MKIKDLLKNYRRITTEISNLNRLIDSSLLEDEKDFFRKKIEELNKQKSIIKKYIFGIPDSYLRQIFTMKFLNRMTYLQIAMRFNTTPDSIRMGVERYLKKNPLKV